MNVGKRKKRRGKGRADSTNFLRHKIRTSPKPMFSPKDPFLSYIQPAYAIGTSLFNRLKAGVRPKQKVKLPEKKKEATLIVSTKRTKRAAVGERVNQRMRKRE